MHGAGLTHILFLPKHAGVIEMFPTYLEIDTLKHFQTFSKWRRLPYLMWRNQDDRRDLPDGSTEVDSYVMTKLVRDMTVKMGC